MPPSTVSFVAVAVVLGTLTVTPLSFDARAVAAAGCIALCAYASRRSSEAARIRLLVLLALVGSALWAWAAARAEPGTYELRTARYRGIVLERRASPEGGNEVTIALERGPVALASVRGDAPPPGTSVVVRGRLASFDAARNPGEPSERDLQRERGLDARLESASILAVRANSTWDVRAWRAIAHEWAHDQLRLRLGEPAASILAGELWGERSALPPDLRAEFMETGTVHVLVTAGLHLGAVAALVLAVLSWFALPRWLSCGLAIACVWAFVWWSGGQLPAVRAATMATVALAARACGRASFSWNALGIAAIAIALYRPQSVASASFALSFSCVGAIFACAKPMERWLEARIELPGAVREAIVLSFATQLGTWPLTAAIFLQFAPYSPLANLGVVPCVAASMALGAAQLAFAWFAPLAQGFANLNSWLLLWMLGVVRTISSLPGASVPMTPAPAWCIALYDLSLLAAPWLRRRNGRTLAAAALLLSASLVLWPPRAGGGVLRITMLDVGQADAIAFETPGGHALLVDAGGRLERGAQGAASSAEEVGARIVVPFLLREGVHSLDALIVSHPHGDHVGGCRPVLEKIRVAEVADSGQLYGGHAFHDCLDVARAQGVPVVYPRAGDEWRTGDGVSLHFIGPSLPLIANSRNDINENSVAFILRYKAFCMLFTGDAGAAAERRFLAERVALRCDYLKVGHHGSAYGSSPAFLGAVRPRFAYISVGRHNLFGHPAPQTLESLQAIGASIYRTDERGSITIATDGTSVQSESSL